MDYELLKGMQEEDHDRSVFDLKLREIETLLDKASDHIVKIDKALSDSIRLIASDIALIQVDNTARRLKLLL